MNKDDPGALPTVSIVIPAYNHARYLAEAIDSVLAQDYPNIELIVIDDESTDGTEEVLKRYPDEAFYRERQSNSGQSRTINKGWRMSRGEILSYLSADDVLTPNAVSTAVACLMNQPETVLVYGDYELISPDSRIIRRVKAREHSYYDMVVNARCYIGPGAFLRRSAFEQTNGWNPAYVLTPDREFWLHLGLLGNFRRIPRPLGKYRLHHGSHSFSKAAKNRCNEPVEMYQDYFSRKDLPEEILRAEQRAMSSAYLLSARYHLHANWYRDSLVAARHAFRLSPRNLLRPQVGHLIFSGLIRRIVYRLSWKILRSFRHKIATAKRCHVPASILINSSRHHS